MCRRGNYCGDIDDHDVDDSDYGDDVDEQCFLHLYNNCCISGVDCEGCAVE